VLVGVDMLLRREIGSWVAHLRRGFMRLRWGFEGVGRVEMGGSGRALVRCPTLATMKPSRRWATQMWATRPRCGPPARGLWVATRNFGWYCRP